MLFLMSSAAFRIAGGRLPDPGRFWRFPIRWIAKLKVERPFGPDQKDRVLQRHQRAMRGVGKEMEEVSRPGFDAADIPQDASAMRPRFRFPDRSSTASASRPRESQARQRVPKSLLRCRWP
jgi:hypothetical protein